jgi:hypothetical protein
VSLPRELGSTLRDIETRLSGVPMRSSDQRVTYERHRRGLFGERHESFSYESRIEFQDLATLMMAGASGIVHEAVMERPYWTDDAILLARSINQRLAEFERRLDELAAHQTDWYAGRALSNGRARQLELRRP